MAINSGVASSISEGDIFIYLCSAQLTSFKIDLISKEINCAEQEYMNMSPSLIELATPLAINKENVNKSYVFVLAWVPVGKYKQ